MAFSFIVVTVFVFSGVISFLLFSSVRSFVRTFVARVIFGSDKFWKLLRLLDQKKKRRMNQKEKKGKKGREEIRKARRGE